MDPLDRESLLTGELDCEGVSLGNRWTNEAIDSRMFENAKSSVVLAYTHLRIIFETSELKDLVGQVLQVVGEVRTQQAFLHRDEADTVSCPNHCLETAEESDHGCRVSTVRLLGHELIKVG